MTGEECPRDNNMRTPCGPTEFYEIGYSQIRNADQTEDRDTLSKVGNKS